MSVNVHVAKCMFVVPVCMHVVEEKLEIESWTGTAGSDIRCFPVDIHGFLIRGNSAVHVDREIP